MTIFKSHSNTFTAILLTVFLVPAVASARVSVDYDQTTNFSQYETYSWSQVEASEIPPAEQRIRAAVAAQLSAKGLTRAEEGGDLEVVVHTELSRELRVQTYEPYPYGWHRRAWRRYTWDPVTVVEVSEGTVGLLTVDLIDAESEEIVWRGTASGVPRAKVEKNTKKIAKVTARMFEQFPPSE